MDGDDDEDPRFRDQRARAARMTRQEIEIAMRDSRQQEYNLLHLPDPPPSDSAPEPLTCCQITKTKIKLRLLAHQVHYLVDVDANSSRCDAAWFSRATPPFHGSPSSIVISAKRLRAHSAAMEGDLVCQSWASISLGFRLLQLLAHAAVGAAHSGPECHWSNKYAFNAEPNLGAEIRMLEACTFGGVLRREREQIRVAKSHYTINGAEGLPGLWFAFSDFPGEHILAMYGDMESDEDKEAWQGEFGPFYHREWQVSFSWLLNLFTDHFWDNDVRTRGQAALKPPMEVGYVMRRDAERKYGPLHSGNIRSGVLPDGYSMLPYSYVMVRNDLFREGVGNLLYGDFSNDRMAHDSDDDLFADLEDARQAAMSEDDMSEDGMSEDDRPESDGPGMTDAPSQSEGDSDSDGDNQSGSDMDITSERDVDIGTGSD